MGARLWSYHEILAHIIHEQNKIHTKNCSVITCYIKIVASQLKKSLLFIKQKRSHWRRWLTIRCKINDDFIKFLKKHKEWNQALNCESYIFHCILYAQLAQCIFATSPFFRFFYDYLPSCLVNKCYRSITMLTQKRCYFT